MFIVLLLARHSFGSAFGQGNYCDPLLVQMRDNPLGYRMRGDRCEGIYIKEVSSATLLVASFTEVSGNFDLVSGKPLPFEWNTMPCNNPIRLRAIGLKRRLYYRMDTVRPPDSLSYSWPSNILTALNIKKGDIGIVGITHCSVGKTERDVYIPLRFKGPVDAMRWGGYQLVILPGVELSELFITLATVGSDGRLRSFLKKGEALEHGYYPAQRGIAIPISDLKVSGVYYLEIGATLRGGGTSVVELWFFHSWF
jgi:hypothetical protein